MVAVPLGEGRADGFASFRRRVAVMEAGSTSSVGRAFDGTERRLPQYPEVRARQREANRRWRERKRARKAAVQAVERDDGAGALAASETAPA